MEPIRQSIDWDPFVISGAGRVDDDVETLKLGAYDYLTKPVNSLNVLKH